MLKLYNISNEDISSKSSELDFNNWYLKKKINLTKHFNNKLK